METIDWTATPLGPRDNWPHSLRTVVDLVLSGAFPLAVLWGEQFVQIYNEACTAILGARHPDALGRPALDVWPELKNDIQPLLTDVLRGETHYFENQQFILERSGSPEEAYFTLCFSPIRDDHGAVGGVFVTGAETTAQVLAARRQAAVDDLAEQLAPTTTVADVRRCVSTAAPIPDRSFMRLHLPTDPDFPEALASVTESHEPVAVDWPAGDDGTPRPAMALPVGGSRPGQPSGVLIVGLNARVPLDDAHAAYLTSTARKVSLALVRAYALEQTELNRQLAEEREALEAFVQFTELAADTSDVMTLAQHAMDVLRSVLNVTSAGYFELEEDRWVGRLLSHTTSRKLKDLLKEGIPASTPSFAMPGRKGETMFFDEWVPTDDGLPDDVPYTAVARTPLYPQDRPVGILAVATTDRRVWSQRDQAVFRAVGDSFRLALERSVTARALEGRAARLENLNAELGSFITRVARNLETPARRLGELLSPSRPSQQDLPHIDPGALHDELVRLNSVTQDLRQLAALEQHDLKRELLPLGELFEELRAEAQAATLGKRMEWLIEPLPIVRGDRELLRQALRTLMAFTLSDARGANLIEVTAEDIEGEVHLTVWDNGKGLSPEEASTLFDLAVRTDQAVPVMHANGLAVSRRILARHGGWAWADPVTRGGKVVLTFPRDEGITELETLLRPGDGRR